MIAFREADLGNREERMFMISTWSSSWKKSHDAGLIASEDWAEVMHPQFGKILDRKGTRAILGYDAAEPNFWYGWAAGDTSERTPVVYYCYVKEPYRQAGYKAGVRTGDGYARQLLAKLGVDPSASFTYICQTPLAIQLRESKFPRARRNPNEVRYPKTARRTS